MSGKYILAIDMGSSGLRCHVVPLDRPWDLPPGAEMRRPARSRSLGLERRWSAPRVRASMLQQIGAAVRNAGVRPADVMAVSITAQRGGYALLDAGGRTLHLGPNTDLRAVFQGAAMDEEAGEAIYAVTGHLPSMFFMPAKLRWWQAHQPRTADRVAKAATLGAWATHELTTVLAETPETLAEAGLLDIDSRMPATDLLARLGLDPSLIPDVVATGEATGKLDANVAASVGLPTGIPVVLSGPDAHVSALGAGAVEPGDICITAGWSAPVQAVVDRPIRDPQRRTWAGPHVAPDRWVVEANPGDTGGTLDAVRLLAGPRLSPARLDEMAARAGESGSSTIALWGPRALDLSNPGMSLGGLLMPVPLTLDGLDVGALAWATLENVGFAIRECVELARGVSGLPAGAVSLTGGMAASSVLARMLANLLGEPTHVHHPRAAATGAALVAGVPPGELLEASANVGGHAALVEPSPSDHAEADERYDRWLWLRSRLDELADEI